MDDCTHTMQRTTTTTGTRSTTRIRRFTGLVRAVMLQLVLWQERAEQRHRLAELDERMLKDIGLTRADVQAEINKPFWRE